jgi:hypothetical protein
MFISCHRHGKGHSHSSPQCSTFSIPASERYVFYLKIYRPENIKKKYFKIKNKKKFKFLSISPLDYYSIVVSGQLAMTHAWFTITSVSLSQVEENHLWKKTRD